MLQLIISHFLVCYHIIHLSWQSRIQTSFHNSLFSQSPSFTTTISHSSFIDLDFWGFWNLKNGWVYTIWLELWNPWKTVLERTQPDDYRVTFSRHSPFPFAINRVLVLWNNANLPNLVSRRVYLRGQKLHRTGRQGDF